MKPYRSPHVFPSILGKGIIAVGILLTSLSHAQTLYEAKDWYTTNQNVSNLGDGATSSPNFHYSSSNEGMGQVWAYFSETPVTLQDGGKITLNTMITVTLAGAPSVTTPLLFGLYQAGPRPPAPESGGDRILPIGSSFTKGWHGFFTSTSDSATISNRVIRRNENSTAAFDNVSVSNIGRSAMSNGFSEVTTFTSGVPLALELSLERKGNDLIFSGQIDGELFLGLFRDVFSAYNDGFDSIGFSTSATTGASFSSVMFSNTTVRVIPEASGTVLGLVGGVILLGVASARGAK